MPKSNAFAAKIQALIYQGTAIANLADNAASSPLTSLYLALHTAYPGRAGNQSTNEAAYTSYARVAVARTSGGFAGSTGVLNLAALTSFPQATGGSETEMFWSTGVASSGATMYLHCGPIGTSQGAFSGLSSGNALTIPGITGVSVNDPMSFYATVNGTLPGGITEGTIYYVKTITGEVVTLSATAGPGSTLTITSDGDGVAYRHAGINVTALVTPQLGSGSTLPEI